MNNSKPVIRKYIDPMVDYGFKKIFKDSGKKQLLIRPLNAIFGLDITDIDIRDSEHLGQTEEDRSASFDLFCTTGDQQRFIVEVQLAQQKYFFERALFYTTFPIAESAPKGKKENEEEIAQQWDYDYPPVFFLALLNFDIRHLDPVMADPSQFIHLFSLRDERTAELMTDRLRFAFLEIKRFNKPKEACMSFEDRFLFIIKNLPTFVEEPDLWDDPYFQLLLDEAEYARMNRRQKQEYRNALMMSWDYQNGIDYAVEVAVKEAVVKTAATAREEEKIATAKRMLAKGKDLSEIAEFTELTEEQIRAL